MLRSTGINPGVIWDRLKPKSGMFQHLPHNTTIYRGAALIATVLILLGTSINTALADEDNQSTVDLGQIVVTGESEKLIGIEDKPTSDGVTIKLDDYKSGFMELREILSSLPGLHSRQFTGPGQLSTVNIRGVESKGVLILIDGVPLNGLFSTGVDLSTLNLSGFDEIEVYKGGGGAYFGDSALGGVINLVSGSSEKIHNQLSFTVGSFNLFSSRLLLQQKTENSDLLIAIEEMASRGDYYFTNNNGTTLDDSDDFRDIRQNNESNSLGCLFKYTNHLSDDSRFSVVAESFFGRKGIAGLTTFPSPNARQKDNRLFLQAIFEKENVGPDTDAAVRWFFKNSGLDYEDKLGEATGGPVDVFNRDNLIGVSTKITKYDSKYPGIYRLTGEISHESYNGKEEYEPGRKKASLALERESYLMDDRLTLHGGVRLDAIDGFSTIPTFRIGSAFEIDQNSVIRANLGNSFRLPSYDELYQNRGLIIGNPKLKPERGFDIDLGYMYKTSDCTFGVTGFNNRLRNQIVYELFGGYRYQPFNVGRSDLKGVEVSIEKKLGDCILAGNYTWLDAVNLTDSGVTKNKKLPSRPEHEIYLMFKTQIDPMELVLDWEYTSGNYVTFANTLKLPDRSSLGLKLKWISDDWTLGAEMRNLLNENLTDVRGFPLPGRSVYLTVTKDF
jgi:vitamin B12 transporter